MSGYPHGNTPPPGYGYGYGPPPGQGYGAQQGHPPPGQPYGAQQGHPPPGQPYASQHGPSSGQPYAHQYGGYNAGHGAYNTSPQPGGGHGAYDTSPQHGPGHSPYSSSPYGASSAPYKPEKPSQSHYGASAPPVADPYGAHPPPSSHQPPHSAHSTPYGAPAPYGSPFAALVPSAFPPGTDQNIIACFQAADQDGSGLIDDMELQRALSMSNESFSLRTVHLLMYLFTNTNSRKIGPKEFTSVFYCLQNWRSIFERFDKDRSGKIDSIELRDALLSLGYAVSPVVLDLLVLKFDKTGGKAKAIEYDNFVECCLTVKGLTDKFKAKDTTYSGTATFSYEDFMLTVLPFLIA